MPGMDFKRSAVIARKAVKDMEEVPYQNVMRDMASIWSKEIASCISLII